MLNPNADALILSVLLKELVGPDENLADVVEEHCRAHDIVWDADHMTKVVQLLDERLVRRTVIWCDGCQDIRPAAGAVPVDGDMGFYWRCSSCEHATGCATDDVLGFMAWQRGAGPAPGCADCGRPIG